MRCNWTRCLSWIAVGACSLAMVADVDAGIIFRRRPTVRRTGTAYPTITTGSAPAAGVPTPAADTTTGTAAARNASGIAAGGSTRTVAPASATAAATPAAPAAAAAPAATAAP